jgi:hypothetical protein
MNEWLPLPSKLGVKHIFMNTITKKLHEGTDYIIHDTRKMKSTVARDSNTASNLQVSTTVKHTFKAIK